VHRVEGLDPGLYLLLRDPDRRDLWRAAADPAFAWTRADGCPDALDLSLLRAGDGRMSAAAIACGQAIAADGCFALAMLADLRDLPGAPWLYRRLFWETGAIGQTLYLEAEALGIAATGIGCFFDDRMHAMLGLQGRGAAEPLSLHGRRSRRRRAPPDPGRLLPPRGRGDGTDAMTIG
jgi:hypothetical protein